MTHGEWIRFGVAVFIAAPVVLSFALIIKEDRRRNR